MQRRTKSRSNRQQKQRRRHTEARLRSKPVELKRRRDARNADERLRVGVCEQEAGPEGLVKSGASIHNFLKKKCEQRKRKEPASNRLRAQSAIRNSTTHRTVSKTSTFIFSLKYSLGFSTCEKYQYPIVAAIVTKPAEIANMVFGAPNAAKLKVTGSQKRIIGGEEKHKGNAGLSSDERCAPSHAFACKPVRHVASSLLLQSARSRRVLRCAQATLNELTSARMTAWQERRELSQPRESSVLRAADKDGQERQPGACIARSNCKNSSALISGTHS